MPALNHRLPAASSDHARRPTGMKVDAADRGIDAPVDNLDARVTVEAGAPGQ